MSGIVGIFNRDRAPVDRGLLEEMTGFMAFRGPDAQQVRVEGPAGLGAALLQIPGESEGECQPCTLDGEVWIAADARVDGRDELIAKLEAAGRREVRQASNPELILHAYHAWAEECLKHLLGDFSFLIWDGRRKLWFGARDHFGIKPFYYAEVGNSLLCGNTLNCLRLHPEVSDELNDQAIADFLLFYMNQDPATTCFAGIRRLPAGHFLRCTEESLRIECYWSLRLQEIRYPRGWDYVEQFRDLLEKAVSDRVRTGKAGLMMSGGLDSTLIAAFASRSCAARACTCVFDRIFPDQERKYAGIAAEFMGIPVDYVVADDYRPFEQDRAWQSSKPEPGFNPLAGIVAAMYRRMLENARVTLTGNGGDVGLHIRRNYFADYLKTASFAELIFGVGWCFRVNRRIPRLGIRSLLKKKMAGQNSPPVPPLPAWLNPDLEKRLGLAERWEKVQKDRSTPGTHIRSEVYTSLRSAYWQLLLESLDPGATGFPLEQRHPFFDVRVMEFLIALPALPWCQEKNLFKAAGRGRVPDAVRFRPKTTLIGDPIREYLRGEGAEWWTSHFTPAPEFSRYAKPDAIPNPAGNGDWWEHLQPVSLNDWLNLGRKSHKIINKRGIM